MQTNQSIKQLIQEPDIRYHPSTQLQSLLQAPYSLDRALVPLLNQIVKLGGSPLFSGANSGYISLAGTDPQTDRLAQALAKAVGATAIRYRRHRLGNGDEIIATSITWPVQGRNIAELDQALLTAPFRLEPLLIREPRAANPPWKLVDTIFASAGSGQRPRTTPQVGIHDEPDRGINAAITVRLNQPPGSDQAFHAAAWAGGWFWETNASTPALIKSRLDSCFPVRTL